MRSLTLNFACASLCTALSATFAAQQTAGTRPLPGHSAANAAAHRKVEQDAIQGPQGASARTHSQALSKEPHVAVRAGDQAQATAELADLAKRFGTAADAVDEIPKALMGSR